MLTKVIFIWYLAVFGWILLLSLPKKKKKNHRSDGWNILFHNGVQYVDGDHCGFTLILERLSLEVKLNIWNMTQTCLENGINWKLVYWNYTQFIPQLNGKTVFIKKRKCKDSFSFLFNKTLCKRCVKRNSYQKPHWSGLPTL